MDQTKRHCRFETSLLFVVVRHLVCSCLQFNQCHQWGQQAMKNALHPHIEIYNKCTATYLLHQYWIRFSLIYTEFIPLSLRYDRKSITVWIMSSSGILNESVGKKSLQLSNLEYTDVSSKIIILDFHYAHWDNHIFTCTRLFSWTYKTTQMCWVIPLSFSKWQTDLFWSHPPDQEGPFSPPDLPYPQGSSAHLFHLESGKPLQLIAQTWRMWGIIIHFKPCLIQSKLHWKYITACVFFFQT